MLSDLLQLVASKSVGILDSTISLIFLSFTVVFLRTNQTGDQVITLVAVYSLALLCYFHKKQLVFLLLLGTYSNVLGMVNETQVMLSLLPPTRIPSPAP